MIVNINVYFYSLISPWVQQTLQFTPLVMDLFLIWLHLLWGEFIICALCCNYSQSLQFNFFVPLRIHHCWVDRGGMVRKTCPTPLHMASSVIWAPGTHPSTNQARRCLSSDRISDLTVRPTGYHSAMCGCCCCCCCCHDFCCFVLMRITPWKPEL